MKKEKPKPKFEAGEITIGKKNIELLNGLKEDNIRLFEKQGRKDIADIWRTFDYNDLIMCLNLGFDERFLYDSLSGKFEVGIFELSEEQVNKIYHSLSRLKNITT